jgi:hypothetical protein
LGFSEGAVPKMKPELTYPPLMPLNPS